jgi:hypothetical protein
MHTTAFSTFRSDLFQQSLTGIDDNKVINVDILLFSDIDECTSCHVRMEASVWTWLSG